MSVIHIVAFEWKASTSTQDKEEAIERFQALHTLCKSVQGESYIVNITGGKNHSPEPFSWNIEHVFLITFKNLEDRDYYLRKDEDHIAFAKFVVPLVQKPTIIDFTENKF